MRIKTFLSVFIAILLITCLTGCHREYPLTPLVGIWQEEEPSGNSILNFYCNENGDFGEYVIYNGSAQDLIAYSGGIFDGNQLTGTMIGSYNGSSGSTVTFQVKIKDENTLIINGNTYNRVGRGLLDCTLGVK